MTNTSNRDRLAIQQLVLLNRIALLAVQDLGALQPMLQRIVEELQKEFGWEFVACVSIDKISNEFVCQAVCSAIPTQIHVGYRRLLGSGVVGECALSGHTIDIDDTREHPNFIETLDGTLSELCVPVIHNNEVLAVLNAESLRVGAFQGQRRLLETIAAQIAGAIYTANLYSHLQETHLELQHAYSTLENISQQDGLTGIANRRCFDAWMKESFNTAAENKTPVALLLIDIDNFKNYNDGYGHLGGDICLRQAAQLLAYMLTEADARLARYGGEEFAIIFPNTTEQAAFAFAERIRLSFEARAFEHNYNESKIVTLSIGVASHTPAANDDPQYLISCADKALYEAKRNGRNRVEIYTTP
ncbi:MAG: sensor domain-containing diguanylate cyclase [Arenimonas sp.]